MKTEKYPKNQIQFDNFPQYTPEHYKELVSAITPVEEFHGMLAKREDQFSLGGVLGGKTRQCLSLVHERLGDVKGLVVGVGLPSPQTAITAAVAKYFGLPCKVVVPKYKQGVRDFNRINASVAQRFGAEVYGSENCRPSGVAKLARQIAEHYDYYQVQFGFEGAKASDVISNQVQNVPEGVDNIVVVGGSGLSAVGILKGLQRFQKDVKRVIVVSLSGHFNKTVRKWYLPLSDRGKWWSRVTVLPSEKPYQELYNPLDFEIDLTYESKAWWEIGKLLEKREIEPKKTLFWIIGRREYDLDLVQDIAWKELPEHNPEMRDLKLDLF